MRKPIASGAGDLRSGAKRSQVDAAMKGHVIAQGELVRRYASKPRRNAGRCSPHSAATTSSNNRASALV